MNANESILVGCLGSVAWVRIEGAANHENAGKIREFLHDRFQNGWRRFVIDLEKCKGLDSTFIGMLYRLAVILADDENKGTLDVINPGERNERSIRKLGLDNLIRIDPQGLNWEKEQTLVEENLKHPHSGVPLSKEDRTELILDAHQALIEANEENKSRFCDVIEFLRKDLEAQVSDK